MTETFPLTIIFWMAGEGHLCPKERFHRTTVLGVCVVVYVCRGVCVVVYVCFIGVNVWFEDLGPVVQL